MPCYGPDGRDRTVGADPFHWEPRKPLASLRVGILQKDFDRAQGAQKAIWDQAIADLKKAGVKMTPTEFVEDGPTIRFLLSAEAATAFDDITRDGQVRNLRGQSPGDWPNTFRTSRLIPAVEYIRAQRARTLLVAKFEKFMADWDVLVMPPNSLLTTTNLTGNPQVVMKCGFTEGAKSDGTKVQVPRSISFLGKIYDEGSPLRVALAYEQATDWHRQQSHAGSLTHGSLEIPGPGRPTRQAAAFGATTLFCLGRQFNARTGRGLAARTRSAAPAASAGRWGAHSPPAGRFLLHLEQFRRNASRSLITSAREGVSALLPGGAAAF